ncbi:MAG: 23S rRNA (uracil(1939)-C(5))-methyltransferase RlmD, partial [Chloroflexota bacterium]
MPRKNKNQPPREPEIATNLRLLEMAYGGECVARLNNTTTNTSDKLPDNPVIEEIDQTVAKEAKPLPPEQTSNPNQVVFVAGGLPGEVVEAQLYRRKKSYLRGNVLKITEPSPVRQEAPCPYFGVEKWPNCGGCQWQHAQYDAQLAFKASILRDQLIRLGGIENPPLLGPVGARSGWGYRNNVELQIDRNTGRPCYHRQNSIRLVPVESCHIAHPLINLAIEPLGAALNKHLPGKVHQVTIRVGPVSRDMSISAEEITTLAPYSQNEAARLKMLERLAQAETAQRPALLFILRMLGQADLQPFVEEMQTALGHYASLTIVGEGKKRRLEVLGGLPYLEEVLDGVTYRIPPLAFFQSNSPMAEELVVQVFEAFAAAGLELRGTRLLDIFCGVGTFSLQLARWGAKVLGIEEYEGAVQAANENALLNQLENLASFVAARAEEYILQLEEEGQVFDAVLLDPPRRGCDPALLESLLKTRPQT